MIKVEKVFRDMLEQNEKLIKKFDELSNSVKEGEYVEEFHKVGEQILKMISTYENILCGLSDRSGKGKFTQSLSKKFWEKVRNRFELIDQIGVF
ncbi:hypothetical protein D6810_03145 [Candidatus Dojkabacteria bacterium]|uniref:Uncharacterized protein n=1 Tax=Candidatus Dojkabacteria bacterium TaxID=2099670 RepID=A0A3M0YZ48_9BACT|nr:MAG: hypothetical protein D6810_03145 [Candidatus Dojkabacteria bacterium]